MSDLEERLRSAVTDLCHPTGCCYGNTMTEAADEIASLRAQDEAWMTTVRKQEEELVSLRAQYAALEKEAQRDYQALEAELGKVTAQLAIARKALEPFAEMAGQLHPGVGNDEDVVTGWCAGFHLTAGHLRTAKAAYTDEQGSS